MTMQVSGTSGFTFPDNTTQATAAKVGMTNRIINGAMMIDQRNAGASVTIADSAFVVDRFVYYASQASKFTAGQNLNTVTPPAGFVKYAGLQTLSAVTVGASDYFLLSQRIEGLNIADFGWGTANAQPVTLTFKVYSSLTGTFGGSLRNSGATRSYPFTYTVSAANTWTTVSVTIVGDTSGTWLTTNGMGIDISFGLGSGSTFSGTAGAWAAANYQTATGATSVVGTSGATFYITGVQLEKGSTATSFDYRPYGTELQLCKRYLPIYNAASASSGFIGTASNYSSTGGIAQFVFGVEPRTPPTGISVTGTIQITIAAVGTYTVTPTFASSSPQGCNLSLAGTAMGTGFGSLISSSSPAQIQFTGCEL